MKKFMAFALSVMLIAMCFASIVASAATGFVVSSSSPATIAAGQTYDLVVKLDSLPTLGTGEHVSAISFRVGFDKSLATFAVTSGKAADYASTLASGLESIVSVEDGYVEATFMDYTFGDKFAAGQTVTLHFTVNASAAEGTEINFDVYEAKYAVGENMLTFINGEGVDCKSAIPAAVLTSITASSSEMEFNAANLSKLTDGVYADGATAFSDARLVGFNWKAFDYTTGAQNGTHDFSVVLDLNSLKGITGIKIGAYKELISFINLPDAIKIYFSNDGVNYIAQATGKWTSTVDGLVAATDRSAGLVGACTYTADWSTRTAIEARYVKLVFTISDPWVFLSEIEAVTTDSNIHPVDEVTLAGVDCKITGESVVVLTSASGTIDLNSTATGDLAFARSGNLTYAKWDSAKKAYVVYKNEINPWPNNRSGSLAVADDEIVVTAVSNGAIPAVGAGDKWVMWHIAVGSELHIYNDIITIGKTVEGKNQRVFSFTAPSYEAANTTSDIGIMAIDEFNYEGITSIHTTGTFNSAWRVAALLQYDATYGAYKVVATCPSGATGPNWTIGANQIVVESNGGNNWPGLFANAKGDEWYYSGSNAWGTPYSECPNFVNDVNGAWNNNISKMKVGDYFKLVGLDLINPAVVSNYAIEPSYDYIYHNDKYKTYTYLTPFTAISVQPAEAVQLPSGAIGIDYAGYKHAAYVSIVAGDNQTVAELTARGNDGKAKDMNYACNILVGSDNVVIATDFAIGTPCTFTCPVGGYIISYNANKAGYDVMNNIKVGDVITLYNINVEGVRQINSNIALVGAGFTYATPSVEESSEEVSEEVSETVSEPVSEAVSEEISEEASEAVSEEVSEEPVEQGYDFISSASDVKINEAVTGESIRIFTTNEALAESNTKWSINVLLKKVSDDLYEVVSVAAGDGNVFAGTLGEDEILLAVHSSSSNPEDIGTYQNVNGKLAAIALVPGDQLTIDGIEEGNITTLQVYTATVEESSEETSTEIPETGDVGFIALGVIAAIAVAGAIIVKKVR